MGEKQSKKERKLGGDPSAPVSATTNISVFFPFSLEVRHILKVQPGATRGPAAHYFFLIGLPHA